VHAGLEAFDKGFLEAQKIERALELRVLRHKSKKPSGGASEIEAFFGCSSREVVVVGDRYLTDVAFANLNGMLSVRVQPFDTRGESSAVRTSRKIEEFLVARYRRQGYGPKEHTLGELSMKDLASQVVYPTKQKPADRYGGW
jgi:phosphatidylglycerophosphatase GEP4